MTLKLYYWKAKGKAQIIRILLEYLKVEYEEINPTQEEWPARAEKIAVENDFALVNLPMINDNGVWLTETNAILVYISETYGDASLVGKNLYDRCLVKAFEGAIEDIYNSIGAFIMDADYKEKLEGTLEPTHLVSRIVKRLGHAIKGKKFLLGYFTYVDINVAGFILLCYDIYKCAGVKDPFYSKLYHDYAVGIRDLPEIKAYNESMSKTPFMPLSWLSKPDYVAPQE